MTTLKQAYEQGSLRIAFQCLRTFGEGDYFRVCRQTGKVDIETAIKRWGEGCKLEEIPARCSKCGSADFVSMMGEPPGRTGKRGRR